MTTYLKKNGFGFGFGATICTHREIIVSYCCFFLAFEAETQLNLPLVCGSLSFEWLAPSDTFLARAGPSDSVPGPHGFTHSVRLGAFLW